MTRFLVLLFLALVFGLVIDRALGRLAARLRGGPRYRSPGSPTAITETLVRCERCGAHVPRKQVVRDVRGRTFCSERCRQG